MFLLTYCRRDCFLDLSIELWRGLWYQTVVPYQRIARDIVTQCGSSFIYFYRQFLRYMV